MADANDMELLRDYDRGGSEDAFAELVRRHIALVYSAALRHVGTPVHAEEITQAVFIVLARKAGTLRPRTILEGWLYETTRLTSLSFLRSERRRQFREQEAYMRSTLSESTDENVWRQLEPLLDEAMARLGKNDRNAVVLRFFKNKSVRELAEAMRMSEAAAQRRVLRALEKLRKSFVKLGVNPTTEIIAGTISASSIHAAPATLANSVTAVALTKGAAASASTLTLIEGALKIMAWTKTKTTIAAGVALLLAGGAGTFVVEHVKARNEEKLWRINKDLAPATVDKLPPMVKIVPTKFTSQWSNWNAGTNGDKWVGANAGLRLITCCAYGIPFVRTQFLTQPPTNHFDFVATLQHGAREALQNELKNKFGLVGHVETETKDVLLLKVRQANAPGLKPRIPGKSDAYIKAGVFHTSDAPIGIGEGFQGLAFYLEGYFGKPVIDQTGIKGNFAIDLRWRELKSGDSPDALKQNLLDRLGLELVPAKMPVEILVVEKTRKS